MPNTSCRALTLPSGDCKLHAEPLVVPLCSRFVSCVPGRTMMPNVPLKKQGSHKPASECHRKSRHRLHMLTVPASQGPKCAEVKPTGTVHPGLFFLSFTQRCVP